MVMKLSMLKGLSADEGGHLEEDLEDLPTTSMSSGSDGEQLCAISVLFILTIYLKLPVWTKLELDFSYRYINSALRTCISSKVLGCTVTDTIVIISISFMWNRASRAICFLLVTIEFSEPLLLCLFIRPPCITPSDSEKYSCEKGRSYLFYSNLPWNMNLNPTYSPSVQFTTDLSFDGIVHCYFGH